MPHRRSTPTRDGGGRSRAPWPASGQAPSARPYAIKLWMSRARLAHRAIRVAAAVTKGAAFIAAQEKRAPVDVPVAPALLGYSAPLAFEAAAGREAAAVDHRVAGGAALAVDAQGVAVAAGGAVGHRRVRALSRGRVAGPRAMALIGGRRRIARRPRIAGAAGHADATDTDRSLSAANRARVTEVAAGLESVARLAGVGAVTAARAAAGVHCGGGGWHVRQIQTPKLHS